ncbi:MAG: hypothetical protein EBV19_06755 [Flavobacteriia bacterium]|nr:hypothetical protein [Flavobacteriia bacterium]
MTTIEQILNDAKSFDSPELQKALYLCISHENDRDNLFLLSTTLRRLGLKESALMFAKAAKVTNKVKQYMIDFEIGIGGFYSPTMKKHGLDANNRILMSDDSRIPKAIINRVLHNQLFYWTPLPAIQRIKIDPLKKFILENPMDTSKEQYYTDFNPCIFIYGGKIFVNIRSSNYALKTYRSRETHGVVYTKNTTYSIVHEKDGEEENNSQVIEISTNYPADPTAIIRGTEDLRLFEWRSHLYGIANVCDYSETVNRPQVIMFRFPSLLNGVSTIENDRYWKIPYGRHVEKNWSPIVGFHKETDQVLYLIYNILPEFIIIGVDIETNKVVEEIKHDIPNLNKPDSISWPRGSGCFHPFSICDKNGYMGIVHEVIFTGNEAKPRQYIHRFVWFDEKVTELFLTDRVFICDQCSPIEYVLGWCFDISDSNVLHVSYGVQDEEAWIVSYSTLSVIESIVNGQHFNLSQLEMIPVKPTVVDSKLPILCINMDTSVERRDYIENHLRDHGLIECYTRVSAVDGNDPKLIDTWPLNRWVSRKMIDSDIHQNKKTTALVFSHVKAIEQFYRDTTLPEYAMIIEDDADFDILIKSPFSLSDVIKNAPKRWEIIHLSALLPTVFYNDSSEPFHFQKLVIGSTTLAYLISREGARKIMKWFYTYPPPHVTVSDVDIFSQISGENGWMITPPIILPRKSNDSIIHPEHIPYQQKCQQDIMKRFYPNLSS